MLFLFFWGLLNWRKPKGKRFTTAKAPQSTTIYIEELMSPSEDESDEGDEWRPEKSEKARRVSKKTKATGVSWSALWSYTGRIKRQQLLSTILVDLLRHVVRPSVGNVKRTQQGCIVVIHVTAAVLLAQRQFRWVCHYTCKVPQAALVTICIISGGLWSH